MSYKSNQSSLIWGIPWEEQILTSASSPASLPKCPDWLVCIKSSSPLTLWKPKRRRAVSQ